jgi:hypothetical protein
MAIIFMGFPAGTAEAEAHAKKGHPPLRNLHTSKAAGIEFPYLKPVFISSLKQETAILTFAMERGLPLMKFDLDNDALYDAVLAANPEIAEMSAREQARFLLALEAREVKTLEMPGYSEIGHIKEDRGGAKVRGSKGRTSPSGGKKAAFAAALAE